MRIGDEAAARRLARSIALDLARDDEAKLRAGASMAAEIEEGRALFQARVERVHWSLYDEEIESALTALRRGARGPSPWPGRVLLLAVVGFVFALVLFAFMRRQ